MIYCVIPRELADELYDKMVDYYKDNPNVTVIVDRREGADRRSGEDASRAEGSPARARPQAGAHPGDVPRHRRAAGRVALR